MRRKSVADDTPNTRSVRRWSTNTTSPAVSASGHHEPEQQRRHRVGPLGAEEGGVECEVVLFVGADLPQRLLQIGVRQRRGEHAVERDADDLGGQQHQQLEPNAERAPATHEQPLGPLPAQQPSTQRVHHHPEQPGVPPFFRDEALERSPVVVVDAGKLRRVDVVRDAAFSRLTELELRQRRGECCTMLRRQRGRRDGGERPPRVLVEVSSPRIPVHVQMEHPRGRVVRRA